MRIVIGLGNPGPAYAETRHNLGFMVLDELAGRRGLRFRDAGPCAEAVDPEGGLVLLKPMTYMNRSGEALSAWLRGAGITIRTPGPAGGEAGGSADGLAGTEGAGDPAAGAGPAAADDTGPARTAGPVLVCDDLALPLGALRIRPRGGDGGQKGLASVIAALGGEEFPRLRLGIDGTAGRLDPSAWADYVLEPFPDGERAAARELVGRAADALECLLEEGVEVAAARYNRRAEPPA